MILGFWTFIALVTARLFQIQAGGAGIETSWANALVSSLPQWYAWALLTPLGLMLGHSRPSADAPPWFRRSAIPLAAAAIVLVHLVLTVQGLELTGRYRTPAPFSVRLSQTARAFLPFDILILFGIAGTGRAIRAYGRSRQEALRLSRAEVEFVQARLKGRANSLQPRSTFAVLLRVADLVRHDPRSARLVLSALGALLRATLDTHRSPFVPLDREIAHLDLYLDVQRELRRATHGADLAVELDIDLDVFDRRVPGFFLQPLVEPLVEGPVGSHAPAGIAIRAKPVTPSRMRLEIQAVSPGEESSVAGAVPGGVDPAEMRSRLEGVFDGPIELSVESLPGSTRIRLEIPTRGG